MGIVKEVDIHGDRQQRLRRILGRAVKSALENEVAGFALVTWDARGDARSAYQTDAGPIGQGLMPAFVHDALNRHVAVRLAHTTESTRIEGDE